MTLVLKINAMDGKKFRDKVCFLFSGTPCILLDNKQGWPIEIVLNTDTSHIYNEKLVHKDTRELLAHIKGWPKWGGVGWGCAQLHSFNSFFS